MTEYLSNCPTGKRGYRSKRIAKVANSHSSWRIWVYSCPHCRQYHVSNASKSRREAGAHD